MNVAVREFIANFALVYSFVAGTIFVSYAMYRSLFPWYYYTLAGGIFFSYVVLWVVDKKKLFDEVRTESSISV